VGIALVAGIVFLSTLAMPATAIDPGLEGLKWADDGCNPACPGGNEEDPPIYFGSGSISGHQTQRQDDDNQNAIGDVFELVYQVKNAVEDPDGDGLKNEDEFRWGTIPIADASVNASLTDGTLYIETRWGKDTDLDGLEDNAERNYWNNFNQGNLTLEDSRAVFAQVSGQAVRDPDSLGDFDGDACTEPGHNHTAYNPEKSTLKGCSHVADDPDSDNDGLEDGFEAGEGELGKWIQTQPGDDWRPGSYAWAADSDCETDTREVNGSTVFCESLHNYWNTTDPANGNTIHHLNPGYGDGLTDLREKAFWTDQAQTTEVRWNPNANDGDGANQTLWTYHEDRASWENVDARDNLLAAYELDVDKDGAVALLDRDSDEDGYTDLEERIAFDETATVPEYVVERSQARNASEWKDNNTPDCPAGASPPLPYAQDSDYDGLSDKKECGKRGNSSATNTSARDWDSDGDGLPDGWEDQFEHEDLEPNDPTGADNDSEGDGLTNLEEYCYRPETEVNRPDTAKWGCDPDERWKYWDWNPCNLDPTDPDTDGDGTDDGREESERTNAANAADSDLGDGVTDTSCQASQDRRSNPLETQAPDTSQGNQDLSDYNDSMENDVRNDVKDTWKPAESTTIAPLETVERAEERAQRIEERVNEKRRRVLNNTTFVEPVTEAAQTFVEEPKPVHEVVDTVVGQPLVEDASDLSPERVTDAAPIEPPSTENLVDLLPADPRDLAAQDRIDQVSEDPEKFVNNLVNSTTNPLTSPATSTTESAVEENENFTGAPTQNPREVTQDEGVVPDLVFSLLNTVNDEVEGTSPQAADTVWDVYANNRDQDAERLTDSSHYKVMGIGPGGDVAITPNTPLGETVAWDVDGRNDTGADQSCPETDLGCQPAYDRGDDVLVTVKGEREEADGSTNDEIVKPTFEAEKLDEDEELPWLVMAFMLPYTADQGTDPLGTEDSEGYVAYVGLDGRPTERSPTTGTLAFSGDRRYEVNDLPDQTNISLADFSIVPHGAPVEANVTDPSNEITVTSTFVDDRETYDTALVGGISQYKLDNNESNDRGKRIYGRGNSTNLTVVFRGTPDTMNVTYEATNTTTPNGEIDDRSLSVDWNATGLEDAETDGIDLAVDRTSLRGGIRNSTSLGLVSSDLPPSGSYTKNVTFLQADGATEREERQELRMPRSIGDVYLEFHRWAEIDESPAPVETLRVRSKPLPARVTTTANTVNDTYEVEASQAVRNLTLIEGSNDDTCRSLEALGNSNFYLAGPNETTSGCLNANLHGFRRITAKLQDEGSNAGTVDLDYQRNESILTSEDDTAAFKIDARDWISLQVSDLPETISLDVRGPSSTSSDPEVDLDYRFTPRDQTIETLDLRGSIPLPDQGTSASLQVTAKGLPSNGEGTVKPGDRTVDVTFSDRLDSLTARYAESPEIVNFTGPHVLLSKTDGNTNLDAQLDGFQELHVDASSSQDLSVSGDVDEPDPTTVRVDVPSQTSGAGDFDFGLTLSEVPGRFDAAFETLGEDGFRLEGNLSTSTHNGTPTGTVDVHLVGRLANRHYDLGIDDLQVFDLDYEPDASPVTGDETLDATATFSHPVSLEGRIVDVGTNLDRTAFPDAPFSLGDHVMRFEEADGSAIASLRLTDFENGTLHWADGGRSFDFDVDYNLSSPRSFYFLEQIEQEAGNPQVFASRIDELPASIDAAATVGVTVNEEPSSFTYEASSPIAEASLAIRDPDDNLKMSAEALDIPERVDATWPHEDSLADGEGTVDVSHSGAQPMNSLFLEFEDSGLETERYLRAEIEDLPASLHAHGRKTTTTALEAAVRDSSGAPAEVGLLDVRYVENATTFPVPCPEADCTDQGFLKGTVIDGSPLSFGVRLEGAQRVNATLPGMNGGEGRIDYETSTSNPLRLDIETDRVLAEGNLTPLPSQGALTYRFAQDPNGTLTTMNVDWQSPETIRTGDLGLLLKPGPNETVGHRLTTKFEGFSGLNTTLDRATNVSGNAATRFNATSPRGIDRLDIQYGPQLADGATVYAEPQYSTSHYVLWDNQTVTRGDLETDEELSDEESQETAGEELVQIRAWNFSQALVDTGQGRADLGTTRPMDRPAEVVAKRGNYTADVTASNLPDHLDVRWSPAQGEDRLALNLSASQRVDRLELNLTKRTVSGATPPGEKIVNRVTGFVDGVPETVVADWRGRGNLSIDTPSAEPFDTIDVLAQNLTGDHGQAQPVTVPDGRQGVVLVNTTDPVLTGSDSPIDPNLRQAALRVHGLDSVRVETQHPPVWVDLNREQTASSGPLSSAGLVTLANQTVFADLGVDRVPEDVNLTVEQTSTIEPTFEPGNVTKTQNWTIDTSSSGSYESGSLVYREKDTEADAGEVHTEAAMALDGLPEDFELTVERQRTGDEDVVDGSAESDGGLTGYDRATYRASSPGLTVDGVATLNGTDVDVELVGIPGTFTAYANAERNVGRVHAPNGALDAVDVVVKPENADSYRSLPEGTEGVYTEEVPDRTAHVRFSQLALADWDLEGTNLAGNRTSLQIEHVDPDPKPLRVSVQRQVEGDVNELSAELSRLPQDWDLTVTGNRTVGQLNFSASEPIESLASEWSRGVESIQANVTSLGADNTSIRFDLQGGREVRFDAEHPPAGLDVEGSKNGTYIDLHAEGLPHDLRVATGPESRRGLVHAFEADELGTREDLVDTVNLFVATCPVQTDAGRCETRPGTRPNRSDYGPHEDIVFRHNYTAVDTDPNQTDGDTERAESLNRTFVYVEDFEQTRWSLKADPAPNWTSANVVHAREGERVDLNATVLGVASDPNLRAQIDIDDAPRNATAMVHLPGVGTTTRGSTTDDPPAGFSLPKAAVDDDATVKPGDLFLATEHEDSNTPLIPRIVFATGQDRFALTGVNRSAGLPDAYVNLNPGEASTPLSDEDLMRGYEGRLHFESVLEDATLSWQRTLSDGTNATPKFLDLELTDVPTDVELASTIPEPTCVGQGCTGAPLRVDVLENETPARDAIGEIDAVFKHNASSASTIEPMLPDVDPGELEASTGSSADGDFVGVHERRPDDTNQITRRQTIADVQITNLSHVEATVSNGTDLDTAPGPAVRNTSFEVGLTDERTADLYYTRTATEEEQNEHPGREHNYISTRLEGLAGTVSGYVTYGSDGRTSVGGALDQPGDFGLFVDGQWPVQVNDYETKSFWLNVSQARDHVRLRYDSPQSSPLDRFRRQQQRQQQRHHRRGRRRHNGQARRFSRRQRADRHRKSVERNAVRPGLRSHPGNFVQRSHTPTPGFL